MDKKSTRYSWEQREEFVKLIPKEERNPNAREDFEKGLKKVATSPKPKKT